MREKGAEVEKEDARVVGRIHLVLLKLAGLVRFERRDFYFIPTTVLIAYVHCSHLVVTSMYLCGTIWKLTGRKRDVDVQAIAETVGLCGVHARYLLMFARRGRIAHILAESWSLWHQLTTDEKECIRKFVAKSSKLAQFYVITNIAMCIFYLTMSQLPLFAMINGKNFKRRLPYVFYTDVEEDSAYFAPSVAIQMLSMIGICISSCGVDNTSPFLIMLACGHFRILRTRLNLLQQYTPKNAEAEIIKCIVYHQNINA